MALILFDAAQEITGARKTKSQVRRNIAKGEFPKSIKIGATNTWEEDEIHAYVRVKKYERDHPSLKKPLRAWIAEQLKMGSNPWTVSVDEWVQARLKSRGGDK